MKVGLYVLLWQIGLAIFFPITQGSSHQSRATYGEPCGRLNRCDSRASLTCTNGTCSCMMPDAMIFQGTKCVVLAGEKCSFTAVDIQNGQEERSWREELPCVAHSSCQSGYCSCHSSYFENFNGVCLPERGYYEECEVDRACKTEQGLICNEEQRCDCNSTTSVYKPNQQRCLTKAGQSCRNNPDCVPNAVCPYNNVNKICSCSKNFFQNPTAECEAVRNINEPCETNDYCKKRHSYNYRSRLTCNENKQCGCDPAISILNRVQMRCVAKVGQFCENTQDCVQNAECRYSNNNKVCECNPDYFTTSVGECEKKRGFNETCENNNNCQDGNGYPGFICNENKRCGCDPDISTFHSGFQHCVNVAGQSCSGQSSCVSNAKCLYKDGNYINKICVCDGNHFANPTGECELKRNYNETCENNDYCQHSDSKYEPQLICSDKNICDCESRSKFDHNQHFCVRRAGADCSDIQLCVENSVCSKNTCVCNEDYFQSLDGMCEKKVQHGEGCKADEECPDYMKCPSATGLCECESLQRVYDNSTGICRGFVDSGCKYDYQCMANSKCIYGKCLCAEGYAKLNNGTCLASHNTKCGSAPVEACNEEQGLVCNGGVCRCKYENFQTFENLKGGCVSGVQGPCDESIPCVENAHCSSPNETLRQCECNSGFVAVNGKCLLGIGQPCDYKYNPFNDTTAVRFGSAACDLMAPLKCIQGICQCGPLEEYDYESNRCKGLVGSCCDYNRMREYCIPNAECVASRYFGVGIFEWKGTCTCNPGMLITKEKRCVADATAFKQNPRDKFHSSDEYTDLPGTFPVPY